MSANLSARARAQLALVEEHVSRENAHDLPGIMATFGQGAWYGDEPWGEHHEGRNAVRSYYEELLTSLRVRSQKGVTPKGALVRISELVEAKQRG